MAGVAGSGGARLAHRRSARAATPTRSRDPPPIIADRVHLQILRALEAADARALRRRALPRPRRRRPLLPALREPGGLRRRVGRRAAPLRPRARRVLRLRRHDRRPRARRARARRSAAGGVGIRHGAAQPGQAPARAAGRQSRHQRHARARARRLPARLRRRRSRRAARRARRCSISRRRSCTTSACRSAATWTASRAPTSSARRFTAPRPITFIPTYGR